MGYQPFKCTCKINGAVKRFGMTGLCSKISCNSNACTSKKDCQHQVPIRISEQPTNE